MDVSLRFGDRDLLARTTQIVEAAGTRPPAGLRGSLALWAALAAPPEATVQEVEERYFTALREYAAWGSPVYVARARAAYGVWLTRRGRIEEAEPLLADARATYDGLGAVAWLAVGRPRGPRPAPPQQQARPLAPDDDPDFLRGLGRQPDDDTPRDKPDDTR